MDDLRLVLAETPGTVRLTEAQLASVRALSPRVAPRYLPFGSAEFRAALAEADVCYTQRIDFGRAEAPRLRWLQLYMAGVDHLIGSDLLTAGITITTTSGIHGRPMTEFVFGLLFAITRRLPAIYRLQQQRLWTVEARDAVLGTEVSGKTLGIVGYGRIGSELARAAHCFGLRVLGLRRGVDASGQTGDGVAERLYGPAHLHEMLAQCDFVVLVAPLTPETRGLLDEAALRAMRPEAWLINVGRGAVVDEPALLRALREGWIAGAALDAFVQEPLPVDSPFYDLPNVIVTPHLAATTDRYDERAFEVFLENLRRYLAGESLQNVLDVGRGY